MLFVMGRNRVRMASERVAKLDWPYSPKSVLVRGRREPYIPLLCHVVGLEFRLFERRLCSQRQKTGATLGDPAPQLPDEGNCKATGDVGRRLGSVPQGNFVISATAHHIGFVVHSPFVTTRYFAKFP